MNIPHFLKIGDFADFFQTTPVLYGFTSGLQALRTEVPPEELPLLDIQFMEAKYESLFLHILTHSSVCSIAKIGVALENLHFPCQKEFCESLQCLQNVFSFYHFVVTQCHAHLM